MKHILEGIKVADLTRVLAGPFSTMLLGDMGAEIIKIEMPGTGDDSRNFGPFINGESLYFASINRNKKSVELDLKDPEDRKVFLNIVRDADVLVENFRPGTMKKLGLDYEVLSKINPRLIYAACSGFGQYGPYKDKPAYDLIVQALGGIMSITGHPGGMPTKVGASIGDITAGIYTALGILAALFYRERTGEGQMIDVAMLDCQVSILENAIARYFASGKSPEPIGNRHPSITPFSFYKTRDSYIVVAVGNQKLWQSFCKCIERLDLLEDERFSDNDTRTRNVTQLDELLGPLFMMKTTSEWLAIFEAEGIPCSPVNNIEHLVKDPHIIAREMLVDLEHPVIGRMKVPGIPVKFSKTPGQISTCAPVLGQHNDEIKQRYR